MGIDEVDLEDGVSSMDREILTGLRRDARCSWFTFAVMVAEKSIVLRASPLGMFLRILSIEGPKSMSRSRSASSRTRNFRLRSEKPLVFCRWSRIRPGVATMMCGRLDRAMAWVIMSIPPTMTAERTWMRAPSASII